MGLVKRKPESEDNRKYVNRQNRDFDGLVQQLSSDDPEIRTWAARDLAGYKDSVTPLSIQLEKERIPNVREAILTSLAVVGGKEAVKVLIKCLRSDDAGLRNDAIETMKNLPDSVAPVMSELLSDPDSDIRIFAIDILESLKHPDVEKWLIEVLEHEDHVNVCAGAVNLLGEVGSEKAVAPLEKLKERFSDVPYIKFAVDIALKRIKGS